MRAMLFAWAALGWGVPGLAAEAPKRPNVLFILADDLRPELGCYGSPARTPAIDALARRGVLFNRAYCQQALCNPSRSSLLTGLRPDTLGLWSNGTHFRERRPDVVTLPLWFKQNGYVTRGVGKVFHNWHTREKGDRRSWSADEFLHYATHGDDVPVVKGKLAANLALAIGRDYGKVSMCERRDVADEAYYDGRVAAEAVRVLGEIKSKPFFLAVGFWKPHAPFNAPKKYWDLYDRARLPRLDPARAKEAPLLAFHENTEILGPVGKQVEISARQAAEMRHGYFAGVSYLDAQVAKVLAALREHKLDSNTIVVFVGDHGYHLGEHGLWAKTSCFELDARVPLLIAVPGAKQAGKKTDALVELIDLFPTLTALCGLSTPKALDGVSLVPVLNDAGRSVKPAAMTQHPRPAYYDRTKEGVPQAMGYSVRTARLRYTEWRDWKTGKVLGRELYDHKNDPAETRGGFDNRALIPEFNAAREQLYKVFPPETPPSKR